MKTKVKMNNGILICLKHNKKVKMLIMDSEVEFQNSMLCTKCLNEKPTAQNKVIGIDIVTSMIQKGFLDQTQEDERLIFLRHLNLFSEKMHELKVDLIQQIDKITSNAQKWIKYLDNFQRKDYILQDLEEFHLKNFKVSTFQEKMKEENRKYLMKMLADFQVLLKQDRLEKCYKHILAIKNNQVGLSQVNKEIQIKEEIFQKESCRALAFNDTFLAAACDNIIKIYPFKNGKIENCQTVLSGHSNWVQCLIFRNNWIISGSLDNTIRAWSFTKGSVKAANDFSSWHQNVVMGLILNKKEDELISYSKDKTIKAWRVNSLTNTIQFNYTLETFQSGAINCISINPSETLLVSCNDDKDIVLWNKSWNQRWSPRRTLLQEDYAMRVAFISDTQFIIQLCHQGTGIILNFDNEKKSFDQEQKLFFNKANNDEWLFPTLYNEKKQIIIQKHNKFVYILKKQRKNEFKIIQEIDCLNVQNYGALSSDGDYLVIWNAGSFQIRVYSLIDY